MKKAVRWVEHSVACLAGAKAVLWAACLVSKTVVQSAPPRAELRASQWADPTVYSRAAQLVRRRAVSSGAPKAEHWAET